MNSLTCSSLRGCPEEEEGPRPEPVAECDDALGAGGCAGAASSVAYIWSMSRSSLSSKARLLAFFLLATSLCNRLGAESELATRALSSPASCGGAMAMREGGLEPGLGGLAQLTCEPYLDCQFGASW